MAGLLCGFLIRGGGGGGGLGCVSDSGWEGSY